MELEDDIEVIGEAANAADALAVFQTEDAPNVVLMDINLGGENGLALTKRLLRLAPEVRVIVLTAYEDEMLLQQAIEAGAHAFILKNALPDMLIDCIRAVHGDHFRLSPEMTEKMFRRVRSISHQAQRQHSPLTPEETATLVRLASGETLREISSRMNLSERTVRRRTQDILAKLGASTRAQAVAEGYERGIL